MSPPLTRRGFAFTTPPLEFDSSILCQEIAPVLPAGWKLRHSSSNEAGGGEPQAAPGRDSLTSRMSSVANFASVRPPPPPTTPILMSEPPP